MADVETTFSLVGKILRQDVYNPYGLLLLAEGTRLSESDITLLLTNKIYSVTVMIDHEAKTTESNTAIMKRPNPYSGSGHQYVNSIERTKELFSTISENHIPPLKQFTEAFVPLLNTVLKNTGFLHLLHVIEGAEDYTYRHSINVGLLAALIGKLLNLPQERVVLLGQAGLLHDIGKMLVPQEILMKPDKLSEEEYEIMKQHTTLGADLLGSMENTNHTIIECALLHHENMDGSGYPHGRKGSQLPFDAQIIRVADVFDAICSDRVYKKRTSPFEAAQIIWALSFEGKLNAEIVTPFISYIALLFVGSYALLNNGEKVEVVLIHKDEPMRPLIRRGNDYVDLRHHRSLHIEKMIE